jgi:hypothetical protein
MHVGPIALAKIRRRMQNENPIAVSKNEKYKMHFADFKKLKVSKNL